MLQWPRIELLPCEVFLLQCTDTGRGQEELRYGTGWEHFHILYYKDTLEPHTLKKDLHVHVSRRSAYKHCTWLVCSELFPTQPSQSEMEC